MGAGSRTAPSGAAVKPAAVVAERCDLTMQVQYINPFIESVSQLFTTLLGCEARRGDLGVAETASQPRDITALIGLSGNTRGIVALSFPVNTALAILSRLIGTPTRVVDATVRDAMAELVNIVAGGAKTKFQQDEHALLQLSLPTVVRGDRYSVDYPSQCTWLEVPFTSELGPFSLRVTLQQGPPD